MSHSQKLEDKMSENTTLPAENPDIVAEFQRSQKKKQSIDRQRAVLSAQIKELREKMKELQEQARQTEAGSVENIPAFLKENVPENEEKMRNFIKSVENAANILEQNGYSIEG